MRRPRAGLSPGPRFGGSIMKHSLAALAAACLALGGCASFDGMPEPVFDADAVSASVVDEYRYDKAVAAIASLTGPARNTYRNRVVSAYLMAIDARYFQFRRDLSRNMKGGNVGFDAALLALTGTAAVWDKAASELAAGATAIAGGRASLNRELYFERTLPALISLMESERLTVRTDILRGMARPEGDYTIEEAFADLTRYQAAASLDVAIQKAAAAAAEEGAKAQYNFERAIELCNPAAAVADQRRAYLDTLAAGRDSAEGRQRIALAAGIAGMTDAAASEEETVVFSQFQFVAAHLRNVCSAQGVTDFSGKVDAAVAAAAQEE